MSLELGGRFVNFLEYVLANHRTAAQGIRDGQIAADEAFQRALASLPALGGGPFGGGVLYIPSGMTPLLAPSSIHLFVVPSNVLLKFGPNARFLLGNNALLVIEGMIEARPETLFAAVNPQSSRRGRVVLSSDRIPAVYPEWWGARPSGPGVLSTLPLQDCLDAAHRHRHLRGRRAAVQVQFPQHYTVDAPLRVGLAPDPAVAPAATQGMAQVRNHDGVTVAGGGPEAGTGVGAFRASGPRLPAVMVLDAVQGSVLEGIGLEGNWHAEVALQLRNPDLGVGASRPRGTLTTVRRCRLEKARSALAEVGPRVALEPGGFAPRATTSSSEDHSGTLFDQCVFRAAVEGAGALDPGTTVPVSEGLLVRGSGTRPMTVRNSVFSRRSIVCVRVDAGSVLLDGCTSHNETPLPGPFDTRVPGDQLGGDPTPGTDLYLADAIPGPGEAGAVPGRVTALQHECQSRQWLDTFRGESRGAAGPFAPNVVLINGHYADANLQPGHHPAIWWEGPGLGSSGVAGPPAARGALYLVHSNFGLQPTTTLPANRVVVHKNVAAVYDLGSQAAAGANSLMWTFDAFFATAAAGGVQIGPVSMARPPSWLRRLPVLET